MNWDCRFRDSRRRDIHRCWLASASCRSTSSEIASANGLNDTQNLTYDWAAPGQDDVKLDIRFNSNFTASVKLDDSPGKPGNPPTTTRGKTTYNNFHFLKFSGITDVDAEMTDTLFKSTGSGRINVILGGDDGTLRYNCKPVPTVAKAAAAPLTKGRFDIVSGSASGNNTSGEIMGVYDLAHDDVMFFGFTNCGSDN